MQSKDKNTIICSVCKKITHSDEYTPHYCSNCGHQFLEPAPIRKATQKEIQSDINCFSCMHHNGKGLNQHCQLKKKELYTYFPLNHVCNNFTRAKWSQELIDELMNMR